jgi:large subunit ribosomal protein L22e
LYRTRQGANSCSSLACSVRVIRAGSAFALCHPQEKFLSDKIKVGGKAGVLGDKVAVSRDAAKITVAAEQPFSKRYCKYLTKRYLRKQSLRDYIRVVADPKNKLVYKVCYYPVGGADASEDK